VKVDEGQKGRDFNKYINKIFKISAQGISRLHASRKSVERAETVHARSAPQ
jgi:hypothetical protein